MSGSQIYTPSRIFTGTEWLHDYALVIENGIVSDILPVKELQNRSVTDLTGSMIIPAFVDLQIYGAGGKLFSVYPDSETLEILREHCKQGGTSMCLPTVATNSTDTVHKCIDAVRNYLSAGGEGIIGIHLEGPWLNPVKRGAHIAEYIHPPDINEVKDLLEYGKDVIRMITLAPEVCSIEILELIASRKILVSTGHSDATFEQSKNAFRNGVRTVTHLFNAMSPFHHRAPGLAGAAMDDEEVMASIIPDNYHVDFSAVRIAKKIMKERLFVITDAVTATTKGLYPHQLAGEKYEAGGILSGSALTMIEAVKNLVRHCDVELGEAIRMCGYYPANLLGLPDYGIIEKGKRANILAIDNEMNILEFLK